MDARVQRLKLGYTSGVHWADTRSLRKKSRLDSLDLSSSDGVYGRPREGGWIDEAVALRSRVA